MLHFKQTSVWKCIVLMTAQVYALTKSLPDEERFGLVSQMRRAAISVGSNFAEGYGRKHDKDFAHFLTMARGSAYELDAQVEPVCAIGYVQDVATLQALLERIVYELNCILKTKGVD